MRTIALCRNPPMAYRTEGRVNMIVAALLWLLAGIALVGEPAQAGVFTQILKHAADAADAGKAGGRVARHLDDSLPHLKHLPADAHADGHFAAALSADGQWTLATPDGRTLSLADKGIASTLQELGSSAGKAKPLHLHLDSGSVFVHPDALAQLPADTTLHLVHRKQSFPLSWRGESGQRQLVTEVSPGIVVPIDKPKYFEEALWQMGRSLSKGNLRLVSLDPKSKQPLGPLTPAAYGSASPADRLSPSTLLHSLRDVRGQTLVLTGLHQGDTLAFKSIDGTTGELNLARLREAAAEHDVNLVVLNTDSPQQAGKNGLFGRQDATSKNFNEALSATTLHDFIARLSGGEVTLRVQDAGTYRSTLQVESIPTSKVKLTPTRVTSDIPSASITDELMPSVTYHAVASSVRLYMQSEQRQNELDRRIHPAIHSSVHIAYLILMLIGLASWGTASNWWQSMWARLRPAAALAWPLRLLRGIVFVLLFLPLVAPIAFPVHIVLGIWNLITAPIRWLRARRSA